MAQHRALPTRNLTPTLPTTHGRHRAPKRTHHARTALITLALFLGAMWAIGHHAQTQAPTMAVCAEEDGSTPGQAFPCAWDASTQGNGHGTSYVLTSAR